MEQARSATSLELDEDQRLLRRDWRFERIGWGAIAVALAAGLVGALGDGMLANVSVSSADGGVVIRYDRIVRHGAPSVIELQLAPATGTDTVTVVSLDRAYLADVALEQVTPEPIRVRAVAGRVEYHLLRPDPARPMTVVLSIQPGAAGARRLTLETAHGSVALSQLVVP